MNSDDNMDIGTSDLFFPSNESDQNFNTVKTVNCLQYIQEQFGFDIVDLDILRENFIKTLGSGNFATTYKVNYNEEIVAAKVINISLGMSQEMCKAFANEIRIMKTVCCDQNPYVVQFIDGFVDPSHDKLILLMEYIDGVELKDTAFSDDQYLFILNHLIEGLNYLSTFGIIHNDIKPENIMISKDKIKYIDLGLSCFLNECNNSAGTPEYMHPEIMCLISKNSANSDNISNVYHAITNDIDKWGLIITFFSVITKTTPYKHLTRNIPPNANPMEYFSNQVCNIRPTFDNLFGLLYNYRQQFPKTISRLKELIPSLLPQQDFIQHGYGRIRYCTCKK
jgi:serine/threonine protein kinase